MRIITGTARGAKLKTLSGEDTRPTTEMVKEAMFSAIHFEIADRCVLEPFGGSGQLSLEALSRGAKEALIADNSRAAVDIIRENAQKCKLAEKCKIITADWKECLAAAKGKYSLVILDPPYSPDILDNVLKRLFSLDILTDDAIIIAESAAEGVPTPIEGYFQKLYRYGKVFVSIIRKEQQQ